MATHSLRAKLRYRADEFLASGASRQLLFLLALTLLLVVVYVGLAMVLGLPDDSVGGSFWDKAWFYFNRSIDAGAMGGDEGTGVRLLSTGATIMGIMVAGMLISTLAGNFQERLEAIKRGTSAVVEKNHFLILGWSEKVISVIDQLSEANIEKGRIVVVVMAEREKLEMEQSIRDKLLHPERVKVVVRSGSSVSISDLGKVALADAQAIVVLIDENDVGEPNKADGRVIKTLMALYNHPEAKDRITAIPVTAEVMMSTNQDIAQIAGNYRANVIKTNEIISKIILQTSRVSGLSIVYDELLRFEGAEVHFATFPQAVGQRFGDILLNHPNGCVVGVAKRDGKAHQLNPPADYIIQPDDDLLVVAEDDHIAFQPYAGPLRLGAIQIPTYTPSPRVEHLLVLGWNEKIFPIVQEFNSYVSSGSTLTLVNAKDEQECRQAIGANCGELDHLDVRILNGDFTSRAVMDSVQPQRYPTVMVLGDTVDGGAAEDADTRAIIALLLLRDFRRRAGIDQQKVCSEILNPKNRELAATTEIHDIVISNEMVSMVLTQITNEPRVRAVLEDFFQSEGSEIYLKDIGFYAPYGHPVTFEYLMLAAKARNEVAFGFQIAVEDPSKRYGIVLNPVDRRTPFTPKQGDRLIVLAEDDG